MKRTHVFRTLLLAGGAMLGLYGTAYADFAPIPLNPASFNNDPVVEAGAPAALSSVVTATMDQGTNKNGATFYEQGYNQLAPTTGMPPAGSFVTNATLDRVFLLPPDYHANNAVLVGKNAGGATPVSSGSLTLTTPGAYSVLSFLTASGNGPVLVGYRIHFADTSTEEGTFSSLDWFNGAANVYNNSGRVAMDGGVQNVGGSPAGALFAADIAVNNPGGVITSIDFFYSGSGGNNNTNNNGRAVIFAVSGSTDFATFTPLVVTGFNHDVVVEADGPATTGIGRNDGVTGAFTLTNHITLSMDGGTNKTGSTWYERGYYAPLPTTGLPVAGSSVTSAWNRARYTMPSSYAGNCATMLAQHLTSANISFATPASYGALSFLAGVANGDTTLPVVIHFQDGSSETNALFIPDWHNRATPWAYTSFGRVAPMTRTVNEVAERRTNPFISYPYWLDFRDLAGSLPVPRLHDCVIDIANSGGVITNITLNFTNGANTRVVSIFAVSGAPVGAVPPVFGVNGSPRPGQPANAVANNRTLIKRWEGTNTVILSVTNIAGTGPISYQWKRAPRGGGLRDLFYSFDYSTFANVVDGGRISGATTSALVISNATPADSFDYLCVASNPHGAVTSQVATVMILTTNSSILVGTALGDTISSFATDTTPAAEGIAQAIDRQSQKWLSRGILNEVLPFLGPVGYTVTPVSGASIVTSMRFFCANDDDNRDPMDYSLEGSNDGSTWSPITGGRLIGTLALPTGRNNVPGSTPLDALNQNVIQVDFANAVGYNSYRVLITNNVQTRATTLMQISEIELLGSLVPNPPVWVRQPDPAVTVFVGGSPSFTVSASGNPAPRYQWFQGGTPIAGATNATYTFPNAQLADTGTTFSCRATNSFGQIQSSSATLTVIAAPTQMYPTAVLANNPLGYWRLNEGPDNAAGNNGVVAHDYRGGRNGYFSNAVIALPGYNPIADADTASQFGSFSLQNSYVANINDVDFSRPTNAPGATFSVEAWVYGGNQTVDAAIVSKGWNGALNAGTGTGTEQFVLDVIGTPVKNFRFLVRDAAGNGRVALSTKSSFDPVTLQPVWRHLVGVCDQPNGKVYLYVDGLLAATGDIPTANGILNQPLPMAIGARKSGGTAEYDNQWNGLIDDVAIYNSALTPSQILTHYLAGQQPPIISMQPTNTTSAENVSVTFYASAYGAGTVGYQWYLSDGASPLSPLPGQTSSNLTFTTSQAQSGNYYQLVVTNNYGAVTSSVAQLTVVGGPPSILVDIPASQFIYAGRPLVLAVTVGGTAPFTFQWQKNGANLSNGGRISGATSNVLVITYAGADDTGNYQLLVSNGQGGPVPSTLSAVTVQPIPMLNAAGAGWTLQGTPALPTMDTGTVTLTSGAGSTARSVFYNAPLYIGAFNASFVYHDVGGGGADGATFTIQNDPRGATALGGGGGALGYAGITPSVGLGINIYEPNTRGVALLQNGAVPGTGAWTVPSPVVIGSVNPLFVSLRYAAGTLRVTLVESNTANVYNATIPVNIPAVVGGNTAYVGFTGADGGVVSTQVISNFTFVPITGLAAAAAGNNVLLSWPSSIGGYGLQSNNDLANPANWQDVNATVNQVGDENQVTVPAAGLLNNYRLRIQVP
ncbi:MAG TPA: immunoglobulin domain-containing protein [Verrucomicrobiae bacterium]|nr:immunoglobulin domain-containing protein [Verrucomicrobiae bacterium]